MILMEFRMSNFTEARHSQSRSVLGSHTPSPAEVDHYLAIAHRMRAEAMASMFRKAVSAVSRVFHRGQGANIGTPHTA